MIGIARGAFRLQACRAATMQAPFTRALSRSCQTQLPLSCGPTQRHRCAPVRRAATDVAQAEASAAAAPAATPAASAPLETPRERREFKPKTTVRELLVSRVILQACAHSCSLLALAAPQASTCYAVGCGTAAGVAACNHVCCEHHMAFVQPETAAFSCGHCCSGCASAAIRTLSFVSNSGRDCCSHSH
jgi:hypothetical protein